MSKTKNILTDSFGRGHSYLRISLIERCNLRCTYCMPEEGIQLSPKSHIMTYEEIHAIAKIFVDHGVKKIRLTGGEPLVRKDFSEILRLLSQLGVELSITTNGVLVDRYLTDLKAYGVKGINLSLDSLIAARFKEITRRDNFEQVFRNMHLLLDEGFKVKLNAVLMKGVNDDEIINFIQLGKELPIAVRFIEFMPFDGNNWNREKTVSYAEILATVNTHFPETSVERIADAPNDTSRNYRIKGYKGSFAVISSVTNPFCDSCNRIRLTANGRLKNCLFSATESDLLTPFRQGKPIEPIIKKALQAKFKMRGGMDTPEKLEDPNLHSKNRSMISIGG